MTNKTNLPARADLKSLAKRLRKAMTNDERPISHSKSLELVAHQFGFPDWNTLHAASADKAFAMPALGDSVSGCYLGKPFTGKMLGVELVDRQKRFRVKVKFDEPMDVVDFASFSSMRSMVQCVVNADGVSPKRNSSGTPHLQLHS